jgi:hypothetical protein
MACPVLSYLTSPLNKKLDISPLAESVAISGLRRAGLDEVLRWRVEAISETENRNKKNNFFNNQPIF